MSDMPQPGIYYDVPEAEYRAWDLPSQSTLSYFRNPDLCEEEIKYEIENEKEDTDAMRLGRLFEAAVDGLPLELNVQPLPSGIKARRGIAWQELQRENPDIEYLPPSEYAKHNEDIEVAKAMAAKVHADSFVAPLIENAARQVSFVWDAKFVGQSGEEVCHRVKGRLDYLNPRQVRKANGYILDLKALRVGGQRAVGRYGRSAAFDIQSALYTDAIRELSGNPEIGFYFVIGRTRKPYVISIYNGHNSRAMAGEYLAVGRGWYQRCLERLADCRRTGKWRGYFSEDAPDARVLDMDIPSYAD